MTSNNYSIKISKGKRKLVNIDSYRIYPGDITFLFGESGIGKSLISRTIYGLLDPNELDISVNGKSYQQFINDDNIESIKKNSFFVFQEPSSHLNPLTTLKTQLNEGDLSAEADEDNLLSRLWDGADRLKIADLLSIYPKPYRPSGGEKQRILLTMAFKKININNNKKVNAEETFFIFDEPTGSLDNHYRNIFLDILFEKYAQNPFSAVIITHDYSIINEIYKSHKEFLTNIHFNELTRIESGLALNDFSADRFLSWLKEAPVQQPVKHHKKTNVLLNLKSGLRVFDYKLSFHNNDGKPTSLTIRAGEMIYLKAPSGMGKTTIAKIIMGLIPVKQLDLKIWKFKINDKTTTNFYKRKIWGKLAGFVFQHADEALNLNSTVLEIFRGLPKRKNNQKSFKKQFNDLFIKESADPQFIKKQIKFLSGGQKQRLNILRTLLLNTPLLILDEPLNGLDFDSIKVVLQMLNERQKIGAGILLISHNEEIFEKIVAPDNIFHLSAQKEV